MDFLFEIWPYVEKIGIPLLMVPFGFAFLSLNLYFRDCKILYLMERDIKFHGTLIGKNYSAMQIIGLDAIYYGFKSLSYSQEYLKYRRFKSQIETIRGYRKLYAILFPTIIIISTIGVLINEWIIEA